MQPSNFWAAEPEHTPARSSRKATATTGKRGKRSKRGRSSTRPKPSTSSEAPHEAADVDTIDSEANDHEATSTPTVNSNAGNAQFNFSVDPTLQACQQSSCVELKAEFAELEEGYYWLRGEYMFISKEYIRAMHRLHGRLKLTCKKHHDPGEEVEKIFDIMEKLKDCEAERDEWKSKFEELQQSIKNSPTASDQARCQKRRRL